MQGGGLLYSVIAASDYYSSDVEKRAPGSEYKIVEGVDPDPAARRRSKTGAAASR